MKIYSSINSDGRVLEVFAQDISADIPSDAIELSIDDGALIRSAECPGDYKLTNGALVLDAAFYAVRRIAALATVKNTEIDAACAAEIVAGFTSAALGAPHHYTATLEDQANLLGLIAIGNDGEFTCTDAAGVKARRMHTIAQLRVVLADGGAFKDGLLAKARDLKDRIAAAPSEDLPDAAAVKNVTW